MARVDEFVKLNRQIQRTGGEREPFGPAQPAPQAPRFNEPQSRVGDSTKGQQAEFPIGDVEKETREDSRMPARRVEVQVLRDSIGDGLCMDVRKPQQPASGDKREHPL